MRLPRYRPAIQIAKVTAPMMADSASACAKRYSEMVKPTDSASMDVATLWISSSVPPNGLSSALPSSPRRPSHIILPPIYKSSKSAIQGMKRWNRVNASATACTHSQPKSGIKVWNRPKAPAIVRERLAGMWGKRIPLAADTEKASIARPIPNRTLVRMNIILFYRLSCQSASVPMGSQGSSTCFSSSSALSSSLLSRLFFTTAWYT